MLAAMRCGEGDGVLECGGERPKVRVHGKEPRQPLRSWWLGSGMADRQ